MVSNNELEDDLAREWVQLQISAENYIARFDQEQGWKTRVAERADELAASVTDIITRAKAGVRYEIVRLAAVVLGDVEHARAGWVEKAGLEADQGAPPPPSS